MIHRGVISTMERMVSYLYRAVRRRIPRVARAGASQSCCPSRNGRTSTQSSARRSCWTPGCASELDDRNEKLQAKIRDAQLQKIPYMLVIGGKEAEAGTVSVRHRAKGDLGARPLEQFSADLRAEIDSKVIS